MRITSKLSKDQRIENNPIMNYKLSKPILREVNDDEALTTASSSYGDITMDNQRPFLNITSLSITSICNIIVAV